MALDPVVLEEERLMPVAGPSLVHDLGPDLGLEEERRLADDVQDGPHPLVLAAGQKLGVFENELQQVEPGPRPFLEMLAIHRLEFGILLVDLGEEALVRAEGTLPCRTSRRRATS